MSAYDDMVTALVAQNVPRDKAEKRARELCADAPAPANEQRDENVLEKAEQAECYKLFRGYGCVVYNLSQARATKQTPGLGDAWIVVKNQPLAFWWDTKRQVGGKLSPAQEEFRDHCLRAGVRYHHGSRFDVVKLLLELGLAVRGAGQYGIERAYPSQE